MGCRRVNGQLRCSLVASNRLHLGAPEEQYHKGQPLLIPKPLEYKLNRDATLLAIEKPSLGIECKEYDFGVLGLESAVEDIKALSAVDGDIAGW